MKIVINGKRLKQVRLNMKLSQQELSDKCFNISKQTISNIERGVTNTIQEKTLDSIAFVLNTSKDYLINKSDTYETNNQIIYSDIELNRLETLFIKFKEKHINDEQQTKSLIYILEFLLENQEYDNIIFKDIIKFINNKNHKLMKILKVLIEE